MYEHRKKPLLNRKQFFHRVLPHSFYSFIAVMTAWGMGVLGYHWLGHLNWVDSILNTAMILGGMGPVNTLDNDLAKLFSAAYALACFLSVLRRCCWRHLRIGCYIICIWMMNPDAQLPASPDLGGHLRFIRAPCSLPDSETRLDK